MIRDQFVTEEQLAGSREIHRSGRQQAINARLTLPPDRYPISDAMRRECNFSLLQISYSIGDSVADVATAVSQLAAELGLLQAVCKRRRKNRQNNKHLH